VKREEEIRLQRLTIINATTNLILEGQDKLKEETKTGAPGSTPILTLIAQVGAISDTLSWVLGESSGISMNIAISQAENLAKALKTGKFLPILTREKSLSLIRKIIKESPELGRKMLKDKKKFLEIDWDELESKE